MFNGIPFISKLFHPVQLVSVKDILFFRNGFSLKELSGMVFAPPDKHRAIMSFPRVSDNKSKRRSQQLNYEAFVSVMAELIPKYRDD